MSNGLLENLKASCRVRAKDALGSATIIYSKDGNTYALTNHHVIASNIQYKDQWDNILKRDIKKEFKSPVEIEFPNIENNKVIGWYRRQAEIIIQSEPQDIALLKVLKSKEDYITTPLYPRDKIESINHLATLGVIGAALGNEPVLTEGKLNGTDISIDNYEYWLSTAASIYGNSGGGVFTPINNHWAFIGIPSRISVIPSGYSSTPITHLGYFIPIGRIYTWLEHNCYQFIYDDSFTVEQCEDLRKERKQYKRMEMLSKMG